MKQGIWILLAVLGMGMTGCFDMELPEPDEFRHVGPSCPVGYSVSVEKVSCNGNMTSDNRKCQVISDDVVCIERLVDTTGGAGLNCDAGWVSVSSKSSEGECLPLPEEDLDDDAIEELYQAIEQPSSTEGKKKFYCKPGAIPDRKCRYVPKAKSNENTQIAIQPGQYCDVTQANPSSKTLRIHVMDIGQGDSIWIQTPDGKNVLIDGGDGGAFGKTSAGPIVADYLNNHGFPLGSQFDAVILTHPHADHFGGFNNLFNGSYTFANYMDPMDYVQEDTSIKLPSTYIQWIDRVKKALPGNNGAQSSHVYMPAKDFFQAGEPLPTDFFGSEVQTQYITSRNTYKGDDANPASIIFKLSYKGVNFMFSGDAEAEQEADAIATGVDLTTNFFKVCHHGSSTSSTKQFLDNLWNVNKSQEVPRNKRYALISSGRVKYSGSFIPTDQTLARLMNYLDEDHIYSTSAGDDAKEEFETYRDDNILVVVKPDGTSYACYNGTN